MRESKIIFFVRREPEVAYNGTPGSIAADGISRVKLTLDAAYVATDVDANRKYGRFNKNRHMWMHNIFTYNAVLLETIKKKNYILRLNRIGNF